MLLPWDITLLHASLLQGVIAATISFHILRTAIWWTVIHLFFLPGLLIALTLELSAYWYLIGFLVLILIFGKTSHTQVPLFLSSKEVIHTLAELLPKHHPFTFIDLGSGCGGLMCKLAQTLPNGNYHGIETAILPCWISKLRTLLFGYTCQFQWKSIWLHDLARYDVVYAYLSPVPMSSLWQKACQEMRPGTLFISNTFTIPGVTPTRSIKLNDFSGSVLHIWQMTSSASK